MSVDNNQGVVGVHSLERDTRPRRIRREAGELDNLNYDAVWVKIQESSRMVDSSVATVGQDVPCCMYHHFATARLICIMLKLFFFLRSEEVLLLINSTQAEASTGAFIEKYSHVVPHMVGMIKGYAYNPRVQTLDRRLVMIQTPARGGSY